VSWGISDTTIVASLSLLQLLTLICTMASSSPPRPVPNSSQSFWRTQLDSLDTHRTTEILPEVADIVVIGAGYAGASTVYHILEKSKNAAARPSIVILEARQACSGATGRNGRFFDHKFTTTAY
jgi:hypothetical protein